jgi:hypothetical protein
MNDRDVGGAAGQAGWHPDPLHRFEFRWFNGERWTADVSADGRRFLDPAGLAPNAQTAAVAWQQAPSAPSRTLAVLALIFGIGGAAIAWMPFLFVVGAGAAIAAVVLGVVALRRIAAGRAAGRGPAIAGIATGVVALGLCVVGGLLTAVAVREFRDYAEPGPTEVLVDECIADGRRAVVSGTIANLDDRSHDYEIVIDLLDDDASLERRHVTVRDVAPGTIAEWDTSAFIDATAETSLVCDIAGVNGPFPFGLTQP